MLTIRLDSEVPLAEQIVQGIEQAIVREELNPGDPLPTVRQLAGDLGVNLNTVARAYRDLERNGLLVTVRGRGTCVTGSVRNPLPRKADSREKVAERLRRAFVEARLSGLMEEDLRKVIEGQLQFIFGGSRETA